MTTTTTTTILGCALLLAACASEDADTSASLWSSTSQGFSLANAAGFVAEASCGHPNSTYIYTAPDKLALSGCRSDGVVANQVTLSAAQQAMLTGQLRALRTTSEVDRVTDAGLDTLTITAGDGTKRAYQGHLGAPTAAPPYVISDDLNALAQLLETLLGDQAH